MKELPWYERTDICEHGHEYRKCADCQMEDYKKALSELKGRVKT